jgi:hypothetical protein
MQKIPDEEQKYLKLAIENYKKCDIFNAKASEEQLGIV